MKFDFELSLLFWSIYHHRYCFPRLICSLRIGLFYWRCCNTSILSNLLSIFSKCHLCRQLQDSNRMGWISLSILDPSEPWYLKPNASCFSFPFVFCSILCLFFHAWNFYIILHRQTSTLKMDNRSLSFVENPMIAFSDYRGRSIWFTTSHRFWISQVKCYLVISCEHLCLPSFHYSPKTST